MNLLLHIRLNQHGQIVGIRQMLEVDSTKPIIKSIFAGIFSNFEALLF